MIAGPVAWVAVDCDGMGYFVGRCGRVVGVALTLVLWIGLALRQMMIGRSWPFCVILWFESQYMSIVSVVEQHHTDKR